MRKTLPYLAGLGFATIFGFSFMFTRGALNHIAPFHLLGLRFAIAILMMAALRGLNLVKINLKWADYKALLPLAFFQPILYFSTETIGVQLTSSSQAGMMIAMIPIFVTIAALVFLKERPALLQYPFILASVGGVIFISIMQNHGDLGSNNLGSLALLGAVLAAACYNIATRKAAKSYSPLQITWVMMLVGTVVFNIIAIGQGLYAGTLGSYFQPLQEIWPTIAYLGILSSVAAFFLVNFSLSRLSASRSSVFANLTTIISIVAGVVFLKEPFAWYHGLGALLILAGIWGTNRFAPVAADEAQEIAA